MYPRLDGRGSRVMASRALASGGVSRLASGVSSASNGSSSSNSNRPATGRVAGAGVRPAGALRGSAFLGARVPGAPRLVRAAGRVQARRRTPSLSTTPVTTNATSMTVRVSRAYLRSFCTCIRTTCVHSMLPPGHRRGRRRGAVHVHDTERCVRARAVLAAHATAPSGRQIARGDGSWRKELSLGTLRRESNSCARTDVTTRLQTTSSARARGPRAREPDPRACPLRRPLIPPAVH